MDENEVKALAERLKYLHLAASDEEAESRAREMLSKSESGGESLFKIDSSEHFEESGQCSETFEDNNEES